MSQLILDAIGDIDESVALVTDPDLTVGPEDALVGIEAAAINPVDFMLASGTYGYQAQAPFALGSEGVRRVVKAGKSVDQSLVGRIVPLPDDVAERLRAAGADLVVVDGNDLAERIAEALGEEKLSLVLDGTGDATAGALAQSLVFEGTVVSYSSVTGAPTAIGLGDSIYRQYPLEEFRKALDHARQGGRSGKILFRP
jgi:NADPH:quinone reductase-like Zn-dependent oxidoreductase